MAELAAAFVEVFFAPATGARLSAGVREVFSAPVAEARLAGTFSEVFYVPETIPGPLPPGDGNAPSTFRFTMFGWQPPPAGPYLHGVVAARSVEYVRHPGSGTAQVRAIKAIDVEVPALASVGLDLRLSPDPYNRRLELVDLVALFVENAADGDGGLLELRPGGTAPLNSLLGAGTAIKLPRGAAVAFFVARLVGAGWTVEELVRSLVVVETGGTSSARLVVHAWGRR